MSLHGEAMRQWHEGALNRWEAALDEAAAEGDVFAKLGRGFLHGHAPQRDGACLCGRAWPCMPFRIMGEGASPREQMRKDYPPGTVAVATVRGVPNIRVMRMRGRTAQGDFWACAVAVPTVENRDFESWSVTDGHIKDVRVLLRVPSAASTAEPDA